MDTLASMALACAACSREYHHDPPTVLDEKLENGPRDRDYLADLDQRLRARVTL